MARRTDWNPVLRGEFQKPYWKELQAFIGEERKRVPVYPPHEDVFAALHLTPLAEVKAVLLGQDPYHGPGQAHGLCFSVRPPTPPPPSLRNIHTELHDDLGVEVPNHGSLMPWARSGVLLLNTTLTVRGGEAASHQRHGWETFTDEVIKAVSQQSETVVFILWGAAAGHKANLVDQDRHVVLKAPHPSPLAAHRGFFGSRPFSGTNEALQNAGREPVNWSLEEASD